VNRAARLRTAALPIAQSAVAAATAWWIAADVLGHAAPIFAPISATIALGLNAGRRIRRAIEMAVGVALGVGVGDLLIRAIGTGPVQMGVTVLLAMSAAVVLGGGALLVSQAASSAVLVAALLPSGSGFPPTRLIDTLVGGAVGIAVLVVVPGNPIRVAHRSGIPVFERLAGGLDATATALERRDAGLATRALDDLRAIDQQSAQFAAEIARANETVRIAPTYWRAREAVERLATAAPHVDRAVRNARVLARAARRAIDLDPETAPDLIAAVRLLSGASRTILSELLADGPATRETEQLLDAAARATHALDAGGSLSSGALAGQVRSIAVDLLRALGASGDEAARSLRWATATPERS
jgi:uncharacterized membrane protein YgaE (UPF0421/DUF939 family)